AGNWAPARTGPRIAVLAAAVLVGLGGGNVLAGPVLGWLWAGGKGGAALLEEISAIVLWSHVIAAGVVGYFFFIREEEAAARLHDEDMRREHLTRELSEARLVGVRAQVEPHFLFNTLAK